MGVDCVVVVLPSINSSPTNVLLEPRNGTPLRPKVKLTDFGLAKVIEPNAPLLTTRCGSEDYAAPEIILGQPYDGRQADIWSLGVLLYALLVGFLPFNMRPGMSRKSFLSMIAHGEFGFPGERVPVKRLSMSNLHAAAKEAATAGAAHDKAPIATGATHLPATIVEEQEDGHEGTTGTGKDVNSKESTTASTTRTTETSSSSAAATATTAQGSTTSTASIAPATMIVPKMSGVSPVSDEAKNLVRWLLQTQGARRPTARELWEHPWVAAGRLAVQQAV
ncbi:hypothetical protein BGZ94_005152 [Podila epigama]|nr:hypothetical protein BGZ94_005152 [Podila epigama]